MRAFVIGSAVLFCAISAVPAAAEIVEVRVFNFEFSAAPPEEPLLDPTIQLNDTIRWVWEEGFHDTTSVAGSMEVWASPTTSEVGFTYDHTFTNPGTFWYYCTVHGADNGDGTASGMSGTITVVPEPAALVLLALGAGALLRRR